MARKKQTKSKAPETDNLITICHSHNLTPLQQKGVETILEEGPSATQEELAKMVGVTRETFCRWLKKPHFINALAEYAKTYVDSRWAGCMKVALTLAESGDLNAIKWIGQVTGRQQDVKHIDSTIKQEISGELNFGGLEPEELRTAVGIIRQLKTKRYREAVNN